MTEPITGTVTQVNDNGFKMDGGDAWINYSKGGDNFAGYSGPKFQKGQQVEVQVTESKGRWYAQSGVVTVATRPGSPAPTGPAVGPPRGLTYEETHEAAQERVAQERDSGVPDDVAQRFQDTYASAVPGSHAFRDLSIMRQNRLNVAKDCLIANLENCLPEQKELRMITPWTVVEFEKLLQEGATERYDSLANALPEDLPQG